MPPVIIMSDHEVDGLEQAVDLMRLAIAMSRRGAVDVIAKPFPGEPLRAIEIITTRHGALSDVPTSTRHPESVCPKDFPEHRFCLWKLLFSFSHKFGNGIFHLILITRVCHGNARRTVKTTVDGIFSESLAAQLETRLMQSTYQLHS